MSQVVQSACPGCKKVLRIPAEWASRPMKCKHCGTVFQARVKSADREPAAAAKPAKTSTAAKEAVTAAPPPKPAPPLKPAARPAPAYAPVQVVAPAAVPDYPVAAPVPAAPASGHEPFGFDDAEESRPSTRYRRRRKGGWWKGVLLLVVLLGVGGGVAVVAWPKIQELMGKVSEGALAANNDDDKDGGATAITPGKRSGNKKGIGDLPTSSGPFPRRALFVSVNNYLYLNPVNYGLQGRRASNLHTLLENCSLTLRIPLDQCFELSDAAPKEQDRRPTLKPVIEQTVKDFLATSRPQDRILLFFLGHYVEEGDDVYLVPIEGERGAKDTLIPLAWLYKQLEECGAHQKVLILDVCRYNPTRGLERPGSGAAESEVEGVMGPKLDKMLQAPPPGVQVISACVEKQHSVEFDDNGVFVDSLIKVLRKPIQGSIQKPDDPIPVEYLVEKTNAAMKGELDSYKRTQTARLTGTAPEAGTAHDPKAPAAAKLEIKMPKLEGGAAGLAVVRDVLKQIALPPLKKVRAEMELRAEALPPFPQKALEELKLDSESSPFRDAVKKARKVLSEQATKPDIKEYFAVPSGAAAEGFKNELKRLQERDLSIVQSKLQEALAELDEAKKDRDGEMSKGWVATYDYVRARLEAQVAYMFEYQSMLGAMRKEFPPYDAKLHTGWRIAAQPSLQGDAQGKKLAASARKALDKITQDYANTPWAVLAKRDKLTALGMQWQATKASDDQ